MGWDRRGYYYRTRRIGASVRRVYVGAGPAAHEAAAQDALRKAKREADRREAQRTVAMLEPLDALGAEFDEGLRLLTMATLLAGGLHQHKGQWRRRRNVDSAP
jgi:hypothetical protein